MTHTEGLITAKIKIFDQEEYVYVFIIERDDFEDFIIGLDIIQKFKLIQDENLQASQKKNELQTENIKKNLRRKSKILK